MKIQKRGNINSAVGVCYKKSVPQHVVYQNHAFIQIIIDVTNNPPQAVFINKYRPHHMYIDKNDNK